MNAHPRRLEGIVAVVTGASGGIGASIAETIASAGARVALLARSVDAGEAVAARIREAGDDAMFVRADVTDADQLAVAVEVIVQQLGLVQLLVNNAALTPSRAGTTAAGGTASGTAAEISLDTWHRYFEVNVTGPLLASRAVLPSMRESGFGSIVNINSIGLVHAMPGDAGYAASKAALSGLTRSMAVDFAPMVRVNELLLGFVPNPENPVHAAMLEQPATRRAVIESNLSGRWGLGTDIGLACVYLGSPESGFVTGQSLVIDGGAHLPMRIPHRPADDPNGPPLSEREQSSSSPRRLAE